MFLEEWVKFYPHSLENITALFFRSHFMMTRRILINITSLLVINKRKLIFPEVEVRHRPRTGPICWDLWEWTWDSGFLERASFLQPDTLDFISLITALWHWGIRSANVYIRMLSQAHTKKLATPSEVPLSIALSLERWYVQCNWHIIGNQ